MTIVSGQWVNGPEREAAQQLSSSPKRGLSTLPSQYASIWFGGDSLSTCPHWDSSMEVETDGRAEWSVERGGPLEVAVRVNSH